jgi:hypothetical protein
MGKLLLLRRRRRMGMRGGKGREGRGGGGERVRTTTVSRGFRSDSMVRVRESGRIKNAGCGIGRGGMGCGRVRRGWRGFMLSGRLRLCERKDLGDRVPQSSMGNQAGERPS